MKARRAAVCLAAALALLPQTVRAWDPAGHMLIGEIAWTRTAPAARQRVEVLVRGLEATYIEGQTYNFVTAGCWMDDMRSRKGYPWGKWHYVTIPFTADGEAFTLPEPPHVVWAIEDSLKALRAEDTPEVRVQEALAMLIHFVGDIHQPMHTTDRGDRGGNGVLISGVPFTDLWPGTVPNLHAYWDAGYRFDGAEGKVVQSWLMPPRDARPKGAGDGIIAEEAAKLMQQYPPASYPQLASATTPEAWARESHKLGCLSGYPPGAEATDHSVTPIPAEFAARARVIANQQVALAGYRLANLLNELFSK
jgi:hypothetical protein